MAIKEFKDSLLDTETGSVYDLKTGALATLAQAQETFNINNSITPQNLVPVNPINLNPQQPDANNYQGIISGGLATGNAALARANKPLIAEVPKSDVQSLLDQLGGNPPPSGASLYESTYGVGPTQEEMSTKQETERKAQEDLDLLNAQMKAINAEATAIPIKVEKDYAGRASMSAIEGMSRAQLRDLALRSLPLEGQILAQQAVLTGSQRALQLAQSKFDKVFELRMADQDRQYDYTKEQRARIYDTLTRREQQQIDAMNKADDIKREEYKSNNTLAQSWAEKAVNNGQADIAARITALDPKSPTFAADLAKLQGKITIEKKLDTSIVETAGRKLLIDNQTGKTIKDLGASDDIVKSLITAYPDAGISLSDSLAVAQGKLKNSRIYQEKVRPPQYVSSGNISSSGITPPTTTIDFNDPAQVAGLKVSDITKSIISGYGTTKDLTPTDRSKVISELYQVGYDPKKYILDKLDNLVGELEKVPNAMKGIIQGYTPANFEANASAFESAKIVLTRQLARLYDVGMLSDQDVADYKKAMPARTDFNINTSKAKVSGLKAAIGKQGTAQSGGIMYSPDGKQQVNTADLTPAQIEEAKKAGWK